MKQLCADDSAATSVKVGYRQACYSEKALATASAFFFSVLQVMNEVVVVLKSKTE